MSTFSPWQFTSPYISYTPILAVEMNGNLTGISASFAVLSNELNNFRPRLPDNFTGNVVIPNQPYYNSLFFINEQGNMDLLDRTALQLAIGKDLTIVKTSSPSFTVDGNSHANLYFCENEDADPDGVTAITVGEAVGTIEGESGAAPATSIIFAQKTDTPVVFVEAPGVTIIPPKGGLLKIYGAGCTVGLVAIDQYTWLLFGDVYFGEETAP